MERFVNYEKLSKRKKKEIDRKQRGSWGDINPVTRRSENPKAYNRKKTRSEDENNIDFASFVFHTHFLTHKLRCLTEEVPVC